MEQLTAIIHFKILEMNEMNGKVWLRCLNPRLGKRPMGVPRPAINLWSFCKKICSPLGRSALTRPELNGIGDRRNPFFNGESLLACARVGMNEMLKFTWNCWQVTDPGRCDGAAGWFRFVWLRSGWSQRVGRIRLERICLVRDLSARGATGLRTSAVPCPSGRFGAEQFKFRSIFQIWNYWTMRQIWMNDNYANC